MTNDKTNTESTRAGIYGVFDEFLKTSVINKECFFSNENNQSQKVSIPFTPIELKVIVDSYVKEPNKDKKLKNS